MPTEPPEGEKIAVLTPMTLPSTSKVGPPELPFVDRRIDLDEVVIGTGADVAAARRHDAGSHGAAEAEGIAYRKHPVTDARRMVGKLHVAEVVAVDLDQREVGARIGADDLGRIGLAVVSRDLNVLGVLHDVIVGDGVAVGSDEEAGTLARDELVAATPWPLLGMPNRLKNARTASRVGTAVRHC